MPRQVLVRRLPEDAGKDAVKMKGREVGRLSHVLQTNGS
jgi:hypothetical protein